MDFSNKNSGIVHNFGTFRVGNCLNDNLLTNHSDATLIIERIFTNRDTFQNNGTAAIADLRNENAPAAANLHAVIDNAGMINLSSIIDNKNLFNNQSTGIIKGEENAEIKNTKKFINGGGIEEVDIFNRDTFVNVLNSIIKVIGETGLSNAFGYFENSGKIEVGNATSTGNGIFNDLEGVFKNTNNGIIEFFNPKIVFDKEQLLVNLAGTLFENEGLIKVNLVPIARVDDPDNRVELTILENSGNFKNLTGGNLDFTGLHNFTIGILNKSNFENAGTISVGNSAAAIIESGILNEGNFTNQSDGLISINNAQNQGILNENNFENQGGDISIGFIKEVNTGIRNTGTFSHLSESELGAFLRIEKTIGEGIINEATGVFVNQSILRIGESPNGNIGASGIASEGQFTNLAMGEVLLENIATTTDAALKGTLDNFGKINIQNAALSIETIPLGALDNEQCGKITIDNALQINGLFRNNGFFEITKVPTTPHSFANNDLFINNAILEDPLKTLDFDNFVNNGIYIDPDFTFADHDPVIDLFEVGAFDGNYAFGAEVTDENDVLIGNFDGLQSIDLINPLSVGTINLQFTILDEDGGCFEDAAFPLEVFPTFNCTTVVTDATNGQNNGAIDLTFEGGTFPIEFLWVSGTDTFTTQNLSNIGPGDYEVTLTDDSGRITNCNATVGMNSQPKNCGSQTIFWDGGAVLVNGVPQRDDDDNIIFQGDGQNWSDPFNWSTDEVPTANDFVETSDLRLNVLGNDADGRDKILMDSDVNIAAGAMGLELTIPGGNTLTFTCQLSFFSTNHPIINGTIKGNDGTLKFSAGGVTNEGTIDITGNGASQIVVEMVGTFTNNGDILVNNKAQGSGQLIAIPLFNGQLINNGNLFLVNGQGGFSGDLLNQTAGRITIESTDIGISGEIENFGTIEMGFSPLTGVMGTGIHLFSAFNGAIPDNFFNRPSGIVDIRQAEIGVVLEPKDSFINQGFLRIGEVPNTHTPSILKTGIINEESIFINEATLNISNFTETGIHNMPNLAELSANQKVGVFINRDTGVIDIAGNLTANGATIAEFGIINENSTFENHNDLFIKDIRRIGIDNFASRVADISDDQFLNTGTITLNFIGLGVNNPRGRSIENHQNATFINDGDILVGTIKNDFTMGGKVKGVGIYLNNNSNLSQQDTSKFVNNNLIKLDNVISGGVLNEVETGHGILSRQVDSRANDEDPNFINLGTLQIGGHKAIKNSGIRIENSSSFLGTQQSFLNGTTGNILINQTGQHGIHLGGQRLPTIFNNNGQLDIGNQITIAGNGILVDNGFFKHFPERTMTINAINGHGIEVRGDIKDSRNFNAVFENEGEIKLGNAARIEGNGLFLSLAENGNRSQEAQFNNRSTGMVNIDRVEKSGIKMQGRTNVDDGDARFRNENILTIGTNTPANDAFPEHGIDAIGGSVSLSADAHTTIDNIVCNGIRIEESFCFLNGIVNIGTTNGIAQDGIHQIGDSGGIFDQGQLTIQKVAGNGIFIAEDGDFRKFTGVMNIAEVGEDGIFITGSGSTFINEAEITIAENTDIASGILLEKNAFFDNNATVIIKNASNAGIFTIERGFFQNDDESDLFIEDSEIGIQNSGNFTNATEASLVVTNCEIGVFNIQNDFAPDFRNNGVLQVEKIPSSGNDISFINQGEFTDFITGNCSETILAGQFINPIGSRITNRGFFRLAEVATNPILITNQGTFTNDGLVEDVQLRLDGNSITNNDVLLHPSLSLIHI